METIEELGKISRPKGKIRGSIFFGRFFRHCGIYMAWLFLHTKISANQVTTLSIVLGLIAGLLFVPANPWTTALGAVFLFIAIVLDFADGCIARYRKTEGVTGWYCDSVGHITLAPWLLACVAFRIYFMSGSIVPLIFGFSAAIFHLSAIELIWSEYYAEIYSTLFKNLRQQKFIVSDKKVEWQDASTSCALRVERLAGNRVFQFIYRWGEKSVFGDYAQPALIGAALLDAFLLSISVNVLNLSAMYLVVIACGVVNPLLSLWVAFSRVVTNQPARRCRELLSEIKEAQSMCGGKRVSHDT